MNLYTAARLVWQEWLVALVCAVVAVALAVLATFHVSLSPVKVQPRRFQMGVAQLQVLVNSRRSALANARASTSHLANLTSQYAALVNSPPVIDPIARAIGTTPAEIGVQVQISQHIALSQSQPLEPQVAEEILATRRHYYLVVHDTSGNQTIQFFAQAPTGHQATAMVTAAAAALANLAHNLARREHVHGAAQVVIQRLGQPTGHVLDGGVSKDAAILVAIAAWLALLVAVLTFKSSRRRAISGLATSPSPGPDPA